MMASNVPESSLGDDKYDLVFLNVRSNGRRPCDAEECRVRFRAFLDKFYKQFGAIEYVKVLLHASGPEGTSRDFVRYSDTRVHGRAREFFNTMKFEGIALDCIRSKKTIDEINARFVREFYSGKYSIHAQPSTERSWLFDAQGFRHSHGYPSAL